MSPADRADFEAFARARSTELLRAAWLLCGDRQRAEDLVQETLARIYLRWHRVSTAEVPVAYARTVLTRIYLDWTRRRGSTELPLGALPEPPAAAQDDPVLRQTLLTALGGLAPLDRAVVVHRFLLDQDVATVADALNLSYDAVRTRSSRALARIRNHLGPDFLTPDTPERTTP